MPKTVEADDEGLRALYAASYSRLVGALSVVAGSRAEAEDVVQEAFARLVPRWTRIATYDDPEAWVRRVALRALSNRRRHARHGWAALRRVGVGVAQLPTAPEDVDLVRAIASLPVHQRQVVVLRYLLDLPIESIAAELDIASGTVKSRLGRARQTLAPLLQEGIDNHA